MSVAQSGGFSRVRSGRLVAVGDAFVRNQRYCRGGVGQKNILVLSVKGATKSERRDRANFPPRSAILYTCIILMYARA